MTLLLDSGFLFALFDKEDRFHQAVKTVSATLDEVVVVPDVTLVEAMFLVRRAGGIPAAVSFLEYFEKAAFQLEALQDQDIRRVREIIETYADARLDFVDTCIIAIAERLDIRRVGTIDKRDFLIVRPAHCDHLEILPQFL
jgi:predicted nucleic acid-binding protein